MSLRTWFARIVEALTPEPGFGEPLEVLHETQDTLIILISGNRTVELSRTDGEVRILGGPKLARLADIGSIEISKSRSDGDDYWSVSLRLKNRKEVNIGSTDNDVNASIAAARMGSFTGAPVQTFTIRLSL